MKITDIKYFTLNKTPSHLGPDLCLQGLIRGIELPLATNIVTSFSAYLKRLERGEKAFRVSLGTVFAKWE